LPRPRPFPDPPLFPSAVIPSSPNGVEPLDSPQNRCFPRRPQFFYNKGSFRELLESHSFPYGLLRRTNVFFFRMLPPPSPMVSSPPQVFGRRGYLPPSFSQFTVLGDLLSLLSEAFFLQVGDETCHFLFILGCLSPETPHSPVSFFPALNGFFLSRTARPPPKTTQCPSLGSPLALNDPSLW